MCKPSPSVIKAMRIIQKDLYELNSPLGRGLVISALIVAAPKRDGVNEADMFEAIQRLIDAGLAEFNVAGRIIQTG